MFFLENQFQKSYCSYKTWNILVYKTQNTLIQLKKHSLKNQNLALLYTNAY